MPSIANRLRALLSPASREQRNVAALARRLGVSSEDAAWIYARSRQVGFGAAMLAYEERCREAAREGLEAAPGS